MERRTAAGDQQKLLIRSVNWLGDAVMSTPALQRLREARPQAQITLLTHEKLAALWQAHPAINRLITFTSNEGVFQIARRLRAEHFHKALVLPNSPRSAFEMFLARIPERIGWSAQWRRFLLTKTVQQSPDFIPMRKRTPGEIKSLIESGPKNSFIPIRAHHIYKYLHLAKALGANPEPVAPHIAVQAAELEAIENRFQFSRAQGQRRLLFGLNAGAEYGPAKRWPRENFISAAKVLQQKFKCHWWIFGGRADQDLAAEIAAAIYAPGVGPFGGVQSLAGMTSLRELCAALKTCDLVLTNDSGPMHLAAAVGTPVVAIFGSTSPELTGPGLPGEAKHHILKSSAPCSPCFLRECPIDFRCMRGLRVEDVVAAVEQALKNR